MSYSSYNSGVSTWQEKLQGRSILTPLCEPPANEIAEKCREAHLHPPVFQIMSDRRGGRTAWSSIVTIQGQAISARFWYDGENVNNAREDAAEVAVKQLDSSAGSSSRKGW